MKITMRTNATWESLDDLAGTLVEELDRDQLMKLIKLVDQELADWDFSKRIIKYGKKLEKQLQAEETEEDLKNATEF